jgi:uncharacterized protein YjdB
MKKKTLLPFLLLVLAACGTSEIPSSSISSSAPSSSTPPSSSVAPSTSESYFPIVTIPGQNILKDKAAADVVTLTEAYVFYNLPGSALLGAATADGTVSVSYFGAELDSFRTAMEALKEGDYVTFTGVVTVSTGGDQARAKHLLINAAPVVVASPSWSFNGFASAKTVDMKEGFKAFGNDLNTNDLGVMYTFTNVELLSVGNAGLTLTNYDYFNYAALTAGKNEVVAGTSETDYIRVGIYKYTLNPSVFNTTSVFSLRAFLVGTNQNVPYAGGANPILRLSGFVQVLTKVAVAPTALTISAAGNATSLIETTTLQLSTTFTPANTDNKNVTWSSDKPEFATVSSTGLVTGVAPGVAVIKAVSAALNTVQATISLTVTAKIPVATITIAAAGDATSLASNGQLQLTATVLPADAFDKTITWSSSDVTKATVNSTGLVSGVAAGQVTITATSNMLNTVLGTISLTVADPIVLASFTITSLTNDVEIGKTLTLIVNPTPSNFIGTYTFASNNTAIATVSPQGVVTGVASGSVIITATSVEDITKTATISLLVYSLTSLYTTGFENAEGFTASTIYNNDVEALRGPVGSQWAFYFGSPSTTSPLTGAQSAQMRFYTATPDKLGYARTNFGTSDVNLIFFEARSDAASMSVIVSISKDGGSTWTDSETIAISTTKTTYSYAVPSEKVSGETYFKIQLAVSNTSVANRLYLDTVDLQKKS